MTLPRSVLLRCLALLAVIALTACGGSDEDDLPLSFVATLSGAQQVPPNTSAASGVGLLTVDVDRRTVVATIVTNGMADTGAYVGEGSIGAPGQPVFLLTREQGVAVWSARATLSEAQFEALRRGDFFLAAQSAAFPAGEIRGRLVEDLPTVQEYRYLEHFAGQSPLLHRQLHQVLEIDEARHWGFSGIGFGFTVGF